MIDYNIVKHCRLCKDRFVVNKRESKTYYCTSCQNKVFDNNKTEELK